MLTERTTKGAVAQRHVARVDAAVGRGGRRRGVGGRRATDERSTFVETSYLLIYGHLPNKEELQRFSTLLTRHSLLHEDMKRFFDGYPGTAHPMAILSAMVCSLSSFYPEAIDAMNVAQRDI